MIYNKPMPDSKEFTVIFLLDQNPPDRLLLLKRAAHKNFAPNYYTGIGGRVGDLPGLENETVLQGAYRELSEETEMGLSRENIVLHLFACCFYEHGVNLYYFYGLYPSDHLPRFHPADGTLVWVSTAELLDMPIIPTTLAVCQEWQKRGFHTDHPFTLYVREIGLQGSVRLVEVFNVQDGFCD
jgi:8-oxo-dGTP pyrophosphatase MutT (NUDIX family)